PLRVSAGTDMAEASRLPEPEPLFKTEWLKKGDFVVPYGTMSALEFDLTDIMDKVVVDDWGQCGPGKPFGALRRQVDEGKVTAENLHAEIGQIVSGMK
ncbi:ornithine cyclodeaminase family protein, partial [Rhizobium ruizarguesonis]